MALLEGDNFYNAMDGLDDNDDECRRTGSIVMNRMSKYREEIEAIIAELLSAADGAISGEA